MVSTSRPAVACTFLALILSASLAGADTLKRERPGYAHDPFAEVRGMTVSCPGAGRIWGTDLMVASMAKLKELGVNWITIHPYGGIRRDGTVGRGRIDGLYREPGWLTRAIDEAHALGLKIMIKPHIAYWGTKFAWRGEIEFETDAEWRRFFDTYLEWITRVAALCKEADGFVVGTELDRTVRFESEWRRIIAAVSELTPAPLTYSAGWDTYENVKFWDALDVIGIQSYFPLVDHEQTPSPHELSHAWSRLIDRLERYGNDHNRRVLLAELGYNRSLHAAVRPWEYGEHRDAEAEALQAACTEAALMALERSDGVVGAFLWKWFPGERAHGNFIQSTPAIMAIIRDCWGR